VAGEGGLGRCGTFRESAPALYSRPQQSLTGVEEYLSGLLVGPMARCSDGTDSSSAVLQLGQSLFPLFALALDLPEDFFDDKVSCLEHVHPRCWPEAHDPD
jgi:hypothetical protein